MKNSDLDFSLCEKTLHSEMVFAIRKFFVCAKASRKKRHTAVLDALRPLVDEAHQYCEIWKDDKENDA